MSFLNDGDIPRDPRLQTQPEHNSANALLNGLAAMLQSVLNGTPDLGQVQQLLHYENELILAILAEY